MSSANAESPEIPKVSTALVSPCSATSIGFRTSSRTGGSSSSTILPSADSSAASNTAFSGDFSTSERFSVRSSSRSWYTGTETGRSISPGLKVSVPVVSV